MVEFPSNGTKTPGFLARPEGDGPFPGVIVIQEWWGLVPHIKDVADRFAAQGFAALAPDLYHGKTTKEPDEAGKMMMALNMGEAAKDMSGAFDFLKSHEACTGKIGSVGYCMGGALSLTLATVRPVDACVTYYGLGEIDVSKVSAPVLGHFAEQQNASLPRGHAPFSLRFLTPWAGRRRRPPTRSN
jgi:carboxymethylenebutenolidase